MEDDAALHASGESVSIRVLLIDDHAVVRASLRALLESELDLEVVGEAEGGVPAIALACKLRPNIALTDLLLPDIDGFAVTQSIRAKVPETQVIILTSVSEEDGAVVRAVRAGAIGYLTKNANLEVLVETIRLAAAGKVHLSARATARLIREMRSPTNQLPLSHREREVLQEIAMGRTNKEIAYKFNIAETTVKSHVKAILEKLGVQSRTQAALHGLRYGML